MKLIFSAVFILMFSTTAFGRTVRVKFKDIKTTEPPEPGYDKNLNVHAGYFSMDEMNSALDIHRHLPYLQKENANAFNKEAEPSEKGKRGPKPKKNKNKNKDTDV